MTELLREITVLTLLARDYLDLEAERVLSSAATALKQICRRRGGQPVPWAIAEAWPLQTAASAGEF